MASPKRLKVFEMSDPEEEEKSMFTQARLAYWLRKAFDSRLPETRVIKGTRDVRPAYDGIFLELINEKVSMLTHVEMLPRVGEAVLGTLEAHVNGFRYSAKGFDLDILHAHVEIFLFLLGQRHGHMDRPLLQLHLHEPMRVGDKMTKDIQFCLFPTLLEEERLGKDSGNIREDRDTRRGGDLGSRNEELANFVYRVQEASWSCGIGLFTPVQFEKPELDFVGESPDGASVGVALTSSAIVVLTETPLFVIPLLEVEFVNLTLPESKPVDATGTIDMVVVFKDYTRDVLQICSIPMRFLTGMKRCLNSIYVKYYINSKRPEWNKLLREIEKSPKKFKDNRGWEIFEDPSTLLRYPLAVQSEGKIGCRGGRAVRADELW